MLYPDFKELVALAHKATRLGVVASRKATAPSSGSRPSPFRRQGMEFHEVREYRVGDDIRSLDWRVTARTDKPHVKVFIEVRERTVLLCIDANRAMRFGTRGTFKSVQAARAAALLGWQAAGIADRVGCIVFGDVPEGMQVFTPKRSRQGVWQTLKLLSDPKFVAHPTPVPLEDALHETARIMTSGALVFVLSDFADVTPTLEKRLAQLRVLGDVVLLPITDPADAEIPAMQTVIFAGPDGSKLTIDTDAAAARQAYAQQWRENRGRLEDIVVRQGFGLVDLHTDRDVFADLLPGLRRLNVGRAAR